MRKPLVFAIGFGLLCGGIVVIGMIEFFERNELGGAVIMLIGALLAFNFTLTPKWDVVQTYCNPDGIINETVLTPCVLVVAVEFIYLSLKGG